MRSLESRIEKLEQTFPPLGSLPVVIVRWVSARDDEPDELRGIETKGGYIKRKPRESEQSLTDRAVAVAQQHRAPHCGVVVIEDRGA